MPDAAVRKNTGLEWGILALLVTWVAGCVKAPTEARVDETVGQEPTHLVTSGDRALPAPPKALLNLIRRAYVERDADLLDRVFAPDFVFEFSTGDVHDPADPTPVTWGLEEEIEATRNLTRSEVVDDIKLRFEVGPLVNSNDEYPGTWSIEVTSVNLRVFTRASDGEPLLLEVTEGNGRFYFTQEISGPTEGRPSGWRIVRWKDAPAPAAVEGLTWGRIKYLFR